MISINTDAAGRASGTVKGAKLSSQGQTQSALCKGTKHTRVDAWRAVDAQGEGCGNSTPGPQVQGNGSMGELCFPAEEWTRLTGAAPE